MLADGAVDAPVGDRALPLLQKGVLGREAREAPPAQGVVLDILDAGLDLALVPRDPGLGRQDRRAIMRTEGAQLGVDLRIEPVRLDDRGLEVVGHDRGGDPAEGPEGVLDAADHRLGVLPPDDLAVALARVRKHGPEQVRAADPAGLGRGLGAPAEVDLHLVTGGALQPPVWQGVAPGDVSHEALHRAVGATEAMLAHQILIDPLGAQTGLHRRGDRLGIRRAQTRRTRWIAVGRVRGWFCFRPKVGAVGQVRGWFWLRTVGRVRGWVCRQVSAHRLPVNAQLTRDPPGGPATFC